MTTAKLLSGASGYSFKEWKGVFYPQDIKAEDLLAYYAARLPTVEINNTFYRMPKASVLEHWAAAVPEDFRFSIKASQRITHMSRLRTETATVTATGKTPGTIPETTTYIEPILTEPLVFFTDTFG